MVDRRPTFNEFKDKALGRAKVRRAYEELGPAYEMKRQMIAMRKAARLTQEQMADLLGTKKSNISRLESVSSEVSPRISTIDDYARVLGYRVKVQFEQRPT